MSLVRQLLVDNYKWICQLITDCGCHLLSCLSSNWMYQL